MTTSSARPIVTVLIACGLALGLLQSAAALLHYKQGLDFAPGYVAASMVLREGDHRVYDRTVLDGHGRALGLHGPGGPKDPLINFAYPPWVLLVYAPLTLLGWDAARYAWFAIGLGASVSAAVLMGRLLAPAPRLRRAWSAALTGAALVFWPTTYGLMGGQANDVELLLLVGSLGLLRSGRTGLAGLALAGAGMWKPFTALPVLFLAARREWRALAGFVAGCAAIVLVSLPFTGARLWLDWLDLMRTGYAAAQAAPRNHSIAAGMLMLFTENPVASPLFVAPRLAAAATALLQALSVGLALLALARPVERRDTLYAVQFGATLVLAVLLTPFSWEHYGIYLLPAFFACFAAASSKPPRPVALLVLGLAFGIWAFVLRLGSTYDALAGRPWSLLAPVKMYSAFALLAACAWLAWTRRVPPAAGRT